MSSSFALLFVVFVAGTACGLKCYQCDEKRQNETVIGGGEDCTSTIECGRGDTHCVQMHETGRTLNCSQTDFAVRAKKRQTFVRKVFYFCSSRCSA